MLVCRLHIQRKLTQARSLYVLIIQQVDFYNKGMSIPFLGSR